jgi:hypothetical protein
VKNVKTKIEKNMESLWRDIEEHAEGDMTPENVSRLSVCRGAYKALCMVGNMEHVQEPETARAAPQSDSEGIPAGATEFEQVIASIPADRAHMQSVVSILADHMEGLKIINNRKYENVMLRLREVANT